jgi:hypothetical protein
MNQELETLRDELELVLGGLDAQQTQLRPGGDPARWSIQQTVEHLLLTYAATERAMDARILKASATKARASFVQRCGQVVVIRAGLFPRGRKAPEMVTPAQDGAPVPSGILIERVEVALKCMDMKITAGEKIFGTDFRAISHAVMGPLSIGQWRRFHLVHGRHHMKQIKRVRREFGL